MASQSFYEYKLPADSLNRSRSLSILEIPFSIHMYRGHICFYYNFDKDVEMYNSLKKDTPYEIVSRGLSTKKILKTDDLNSIRCMVNSERIEKLKYINSLPIDYGLKQDIYFDYDEKLKLYEGKFLQNSKRIIFNIKYHYHLTNLSLEDIRMELRSTQLLVNMVSKNSIKRNTYSVLCDQFIHIIELSISFHEKYKLVLDECNKMGYTFNKYDNIINLLEDMLELINMINLHNVERKRFSSSLSKFQQHRLGKLINKNCKNYKNIVTDIDLTADITYYDK